jgi:hypothetical protein
MKIEHKWKPIPSREVDTEFLLLGNHCEDVDARVYRLEMIVAALIDELQLTDEQKKKMLASRLGSWKFVERNKP